jgi:hypothetical protein
MAKSPTEQFRDLALELRARKERDAARERELARLQDELSELNADLAKEREARIGLQVENSALKQQFHDHLAQYQEWDKRRWGLIVLVFGAVLSSVLGLIVARAKVSRR